MAPAASLSAVAAVLLLFSWPLLLAAEQPSCQLVISQLGPCLPYVLRSVRMPPDMCCNGVLFLGSRYSQDHEARQAICECVQHSISPVLPIDFDLVNTLPIACGINVHLPKLSFSVDCSQV
ncbi:non-specific lipid-transfer protein 1-like [Punica granatum]|uniref:Non-specific lipid-transfer protein 1-like n=1 Tax=Punica granatum TaxID=22663 RepID=A0A6P8C1U5_PUNGR|nr:non-specific lipid-transfer protein 1-like [Punica granatum]